MTESRLEGELEALLSEDVASVMDRERSEFDRLSSPFGNRIVLFGAGGLGRKTLAGLRELSVEPLAFTDNNPALWESEINGVRVLPPQEAAQKFGQDATFVITIWKGEAIDRMAERRQQMAELGCSRVVPFGYLFWAYPDIFLPHYALDLPHKVYEHANEIRGLFHLWADDASRREYLAQMKWRMLLDFDSLPLPVTHETYFPNDLVNASPNDVFVDCGAFDGDTLRDFLRLRDKRFEQYIAFEPDAKNFLRLQQYVSTLPHRVARKVTMHQLAVGARAEKVSFLSSGTESSAVGPGAIEVDSVAMDDILDGYIPTVVKMDVEGSELEALAGAKRLIERTLPVLAICVYHKQEHLWQIPPLIHSISHEYRLYLRPHLQEVWDLVCYAIPVNWSARQPLKV